jgi:hypothetical protein
VTRIATAVGVLLLAVGCAGSHSSPSAATLRHHYYLVGERQCERTLRKAEAQQGSGELMGIRILIDTGKYPKEFRKAVSAGCQAAPG